MRHFNHKHGESAYGDRKPTPEYTAYAGMIARCSQKSNPAYPRYGGRGITVCDRWLNGDGDLSGYECFLVDMGRRPSPRHSVDRRDNNLGYGPGNCRWATGTQQNRNRRGLHLVEYRGRLVPLSQACEEAGLSYGMVKRRINKYGWTAERALSVADNQNYKMIEVQGRIVSIRDAAHICGIDEATLGWRIRKGWPLERALKPPQRR